MKGDCLLCYHCLKWLCSFYIPILANRKAKIGGEDEFSAKVMELNFNLRKLVHTFLFEGKKIFNYI